MMHPWVHEASELLSFGVKIEYFVVDRLAAVVFWVTHYTHNIVGLQSHVDFIDPGRYNYLFSVLDLILLILLLVGHAIKMDHRLAVIEA